MNLSKYTFLFISAHTIFSTGLSASEVDHLLATGNEIKEKGFMFDVLHINQPINVTYYDKIKENKAVLLWWVLQDYLSFGDDYYKNISSMRDYTGNGICIKKHRQLRNDGHSMITYEYTPEWEVAGKGDLNSLDMEVHFKNIDGHHQLMCVRPNLPFRCGDEMSAEGISYPQVSAFYRRKNRYGMFVPELEFDYGRVLVTIEAAKGSRLNYVLSDCYKGEIDTHERDNASFMDKNSSFEEIPWWEK